MTSVKTVTDAKDLFNSIYRSFESLNEPFKKKEEIVSFFKSMQGTIETIKIKFGIEEDTHSSSSEEKEKKILKWLKLLKWGKVKKKKSDEFFKLLDNFIDQNYKTNCDKEITKILENTSLNKIFIKKKFNELYEKLNYLTKIFINKFKQIFLNVFKERKPNDGVKYVLIRFISKDNDTSLGQVEEVVPSDNKKKLTNKVYCCTYTLKNQNCKEMSYRKYVSDGWGAGSCAVGFFGLDKIGINADDSIIPGFDYTLNRVRGEFSMYNAGSSCNHISHLYHLWGQNNHKSNCCYHMLIAILDKDIIENHLREIPIVNKTDILEKNEKKHILIHETPDIIESYGKTDNIQRVPAEKLFIPNELITMKGILIEMNDFGKNLKTFEKNNHTALQILEKMKYKEDTIEQTKDTIEHFINKCSKQRKQ